MQHSLVVQTAAAQTVEFGFATKTCGAGQPANPVHVGAAEKQSGGGETVNAFRPRGWREERHVQ